MCAIIYNFLKYLHMVAINILNVEGTYCLQMWLLGCPSIVVHGLKTVQFFMTHLGTLEIKNFIRK